MEAALRTVYEVVTGTELPKIVFEVRGGARCGRMGGQTGGELGQLLDGQGRATGRALGRCEAATATGCCRSVGWPLACRRVVHAEVKVPSPATSHRSATQPQFPPAPLPTSPPPHNHAAAPVLLLRCCCPADPPLPSASHRRSAGSRASRRPPSRSSPARPASSASTTRLATASTFASPWPTAWATQRSSSQTCRRARQSECHAGTTGGRGVCVWRQGGGRLKPRLLGIVRCDFV